MNQGRSMHHQRKGIVGCCPQCDAKPGEPCRTTSKPATDRMLQFFEYGHLPEKLAAVSKPFCDLAQIMVDTLPSNPERTAGLRKLIEAKDCAVRAALYKEP